MTQPIQVISMEDLALRPAPIPKEWILSGAPNASNQLVCKSRDRLQYTLVWRCTAGSFRWIYDEDETIQVLDGGMTLHFDDGAQRVCAAGDVVFFPAGTSCVWVIETEVRKLAFFRTPAPGWMALAQRVGRKASQILSRLPGRSATARVQPMGEAVAA